MAQSVEIPLAAGKGTVHGYCDERFEAVLDAFVANFNSDEEVGASVSINIEGEYVVQLWGGRQHPKQDADWEQDTLCIVHSVTKAAVSLCAHILLAEGKLALHAPVTDYWPEYGQAGKEETSVAMMLNHSCGMPAFREPLKEGAYYDWDYMVERIANEEAFWTPGDRHGYQMSTYGWTVGELVRRASGMSLGEYFSQRVAKPLNLDFYIGLPDSEHHRVSRTMRWTPKRGDPVSAFTHALLQDKSSIQNRAFMNHGGFKSDTPESYRCEFGAGGGLASAHGIAGMYRPLANGGGELVDALALERMSATSVSGMDATLLLPSRFSLGFMLSMDNRHRPTGALETVIMGKHAFGHAGAGGSLGFADTECHMGFGYAMNKLGAGILVNNRGQSLVDAAYTSLGYLTNEPGYWISS